FVRGGRPLSAWLWELVAEDAQARLAAGQALRAMMWSSPSIHTDLRELDWTSPADFARHVERFQEAVQAAVRAPHFPLAEFVRRLIRRRIALQEDWNRRVHAHLSFDKTPSAFEDRLVRRIEASTGEAERSRAIRRYCRWLCAKANRDARRSEAIYEGAESLTDAGTMAGAVFGALDDVLLADRPGLRAMLDDETLRNEAAEALARIGPPAVDFAGFFLEQLDAQADSYRFGGAKALGSISRNDPTVIDALLRRLRSGPEPVRIGAAEALGHADPPLAGRLEIALDMLLGATHSSSLVYAATEALASVGRDREEALQRVLELAAPRPPRWRTAESMPDYQSDEVMLERGVAISALRHFRRFAARVVPALAAAFDTFEEYDPDWSDDHGRVCWALETFGADAAPAVPRLVRYLDEWSDRPEEERQWPKHVFGLLGSIGPAASEALPTLDRLRTASAATDDTSGTALDPSDPLDQAILAIRGVGLV
ncbi:MAG TPA: HEAT repeat domain-containing protein, partial [Gemmataceae bacterium]|nr:HEAT repeat domain-containing protein [Gemmataceae bacterium]